MDIEKIVEAFAKRGLVPPLHFHDVHDNNIDNYYAVGQREEIIRGEYLTIRKPGRPKATDRTLADYVCEGIDPTTLKTMITDHLRHTMGTAEDVAHLEKTLITEKKIKAAIPYKLLKSEFGELIKCTHQQLNRSERTIKLR